MARAETGRTTPLTREEIVDRALSLVDAEGLEALTMRRLAGELGVSSMAVYHHFETKDEVLQATVDRVWDEVTSEFRLLTAPADVLELLMHVARTTRQVFLGHYEIVPLAFGMPRARDRMIDSMTVMAAGLEVAGFPDIGLALYTLQMYTLGSISLTAHRLHDLRDRGTTEAELAAYFRANLGDNIADDDVRLLALPAVLPSAQDDFFDEGLKVVVAALLPRRPLRRHF